MIKMIDDEREEKVTGYGYLNYDNDLEEVIGHEEMLTICVDGNEVHIYKSDVPKIIKALTLAAKL